MMMGAGSSSRGDLREENLCIREGCYGVSCVCDRVCDV